MIASRGCTAAWFGLLAISVAPIAAAGCQNNRAPRIDFESLLRRDTDAPKNTGASRHGKSTAIHVDFYLDASVPMRGFLTMAKDGQRNYFEDLLQNAGSILMKGWDKSTAAYWTFGATTEKIATLDDFLRPGTDGKHRFNQLQSRIHDAVRHPGAGAAGTPRLRVIVTDLFLTDANASGLAKDLLDQYLSTRDQAIAVLGMRSSFDGAVSDLPGTVPKGGLDSLPLYVLIAGPVGDVRQIVANFEHWLNLEGAASRAAFTILFARELTNTTNRAIEVRPAAPKEPKPPGFSTRTAWLPEARQRGIPQIKMTGQRIQVQLVDEREGFAHTTGLMARPAPVVLTRVDAWPNGRHQAASEREKRAFTFTNKPGTAVFWLTIDRAHLREGTTYLLQFEVHAERTSVLDLRAKDASAFRISEWSLEPSEAHRIVDQRTFNALADRSKPGRTPNLRQFLQTLADRMFQAPIELARYALIVSVD
jgi:hypothetical protein